MSGRTCTGLPWNDGIRMVGDPVDVVTGAQTHSETDFRVRDGFLFISWVRWYDSSSHGLDRGLGPGFRHGLDVELSYDVDGMTYVDGRGQEIAFPTMDRDGGRALREGHVLERVDAACYRLHRPGGKPSFEFQFGRDLGQAARPVSLFLDGSRRRPVRLHHERDQLAAIDVDVDRRIVIEMDGQKVVGALLITRQGVGSASRSNGGDSRPEQKQRLVRYTYDALGRLSGAENAYGHALLYEYDHAGRMSRKVDHRGYSFSFVHDDQGRCVHTRGEDGVEDYRLEYRPQERMTVVVRRDGATRQYSYDASGSLVQIIDPCGGLTSYLRGEDGHTAAEIDPLGAETKILYDVRDLPFAKLDPQGHLRALPADPLPHPLSHRLPESPLVWQQGDWAGSSRSLRNGGRVPDAQIPPWALGAVGLSREADLRSPELVFNVQGLPIKEQRADGKTRRWSFDPNGYFRWYTDFEGRKSTYEYGSWNHLLREIDPRGSVVEYEYSPGEKVSAVTDGNGTRHEYGYDLKDRLVEVRRHGRVRERYSYDAADNLVEKRDGEGRLILKLTVAPGNLIKQRALASGDTHQLDHDAQGHLVGAKNQAGACTFTYDLSGRQTGDLRDERGVVHRFEDGRLAETTVLERFRTQYLRTDATTVVVLDPANQAHRMRRLSSGLIERTSSDGARELSHYDTAGRCLLLVAEGPGFGPTDSGWARRFTYSGEGDLQRREDSVRGRTEYELDPTRRLARVQLPDETSQAYVYDRAGNLLEGPGLKVVGRDGNRMRAVNGDPVQYDDRDHLSARHTPQGEIRYRYDSRDQLVAVDGPGISYRAKHDALGRRTEKAVGADTWRYYWDNDRLAAEIAPDGRFRVYVYPDAVALVPILFLDYDNVDADPSTGRRYHLFGDHLGCPELILDEGGRTVWRARIDAYGTAHVEVGEQFHQPLRWPGHYFDWETGLHENRFRTYSPEIGRYLQSDPSGTAGGLNLYAYTDNPLRGVDLLGLAQRCPDDVEDCPHRKKDGADKEDVAEGEVGSYKDLKAREKTGDNLEHDHIPAYASVRDAINAQRKKNGEPKLTEAQEGKLRDTLTAMEVPKDMHKDGRTHSGKGGKERQAEDAKNLQAAAEKDLQAHRENVENDGHMDPEAFDQSAAAVHERNQEIGLYDKKFPPSLWGE